VPKRGEVGFPILLKKENEDRSLTFRDALVTVFLADLFWNIVLLVGVVAGKPMTNAFTGIDSVVGAPARLLLQVMVK